MKTDIFYDVNVNWLTNDVLGIAHMINETNDFSVLPILADALEIAGCTNEKILEHCRDPNIESHRARTPWCWVVGAILGAEVMEKREKKELESKRMVHGHVNIIGLEWPPG
jgi:hypothetical protein